MFRILIKEKQFGHKEYLSFFGGIVRVHTVTMVVFKKYVNTVDVVYSSQHNIKLSSISNCSCPCTGICISINCIIRQFKVSSEMDTYGMEWLFFQRKDHLKTIFKKTKMLQDTSILSFTHVIQNHTYTCEKNQIFAVK